MQITQQGAVVVNDYTPVYRNEEITCLELDFKSKYIGTPIVGSRICKGVSIPIMTVCAHEGTLRLDDTKPRESTTVLEFPEFADWEVFCCDGPYRYTVRLVLMKRAEHG